MPGADEDEFAAFQAELTKLDAPSGAVGPRAPQVISAAPTGPVITKVSRAPLPPSAATLAGGARLPVSQWPKPDQLVSSIQRDYPDAPMPELGKQPGTLVGDQASAAAGSSAAGSSAAPLSAAAALSVGRLQPGQMPGDGTIKMSGEPSRHKAVEKPPAPPPGGPLGKRKEPEKPNATKRSVAGKCWVDNSLADWPEDDFRIFVGDLGNETNDDVLAHAFAKYPSFQKAKVIRNKHTQKSMGYGFVSFKDPWDMTKECT